MSASEAFEPDLMKRDAWRPDEVARRLAEVDAPWYVAAGWAIDLFLGEQRREHEDLEIAVPRGRFAQVAQVLTEFELFVAGGGLVRPLPPDGNTLEEYHQTWVREPATGLWRLDVFLEPSNGDTWICRRDARIQLPYHEVIDRTADGIPYRRPEIVLLFKAKHADRAKDGADLAAVLPVLESPRRRWLAESIALVHPNHPWLAELA